MHLGNSWVFCCRGQVADALRRGRSSVGVVHLALHDGHAGLVGAWQRSVEAMTEPSEALSPFLDPPGVPEVPRAAAGAWGWGLDNQATSLP